MMSQGEGLANNHQFKLVKEQHKKCGHFLGGAELMKKPTAAPFQLQGFSYKHRPLCMANQHKEPLCPVCAPGMGGHQQEASRAWLVPGTTGGKRSGELNAEKPGCACVFRAAPESAG